MVIGHQLQNNCVKNLQDKQECIPVACVPPAAVAVGGVSTRHPPGADPPRTEFLTHACENITLTQTSSAGGENNISCSLGSLPSFYGNGNTYNPDLSHGSIIGRIFTPYWRLYLPRIGNRSRGY